MWANLSEYAIDGAPMVWTKIPVLVEAFARFPEAKWVWWLDFDSIIMTPTIDLGSHLLNPEPMLEKIRKGELYKLRGEEHGDEIRTLTNPDPNQINLIIAGDHNGINAGSFFLRRGGWTEMFLDLWEDPLYLANDWPGKEQDAMIHLIQFHKVIRNHLGIVPQRTLNSYYDGSEDMIWHENDLVVHLAGCW
jgi:hypothetical protein